MKKSSEYSISVIEHVFTTSKTQNYSEKSWYPIEICSLIRHFTVAVDVPRESKLNIEPSKGELHRIYDSWNWTSAIYIYIFGKYG